MAGVQFCESRSDRVRVCRAPRRVVSSMSDDGAAQNPAADSAEAVRAEIDAAQQAFEEDVKKQGLYVTHEVKFRYAVALSKSEEKDDWMLARWFVIALCPSAPPAP